MLWRQIHQPTESLQRLSGIESIFTCDLVLATGIHAKDCWLYSLTIPLESTLAAVPSTVNLSEEKKKYIITKHSTELLNASSLLHTPLGLKRFQEKVIFGGQHGSFIKFGRVHKGCAIRSNEHLVSGKSWVRSLACQRRVGISTKEKSRVSSIWKWSSKL